ncbi:MAG: metal ABC transporter substrate-binding protein [Clostridiaceae bacterium]|nr:metal ABC transporter substrate-binding protein [Clostridiaceae bacterium]
MKKIISLLTALIIAAGLAGCSSSSQNAKSGADESENAEKLHVVCTIFPQYDWVHEIMGNSDNAELTLLLDNGVDLHNYQPTADDIIKISDCDLFIYVGGESDAWVDDALKEAVNKDMVVLNLMDILGDKIKEEEVVEGMESEEHGHGEEPEYDEHVWLSLKNAETICDAITDALCGLDPSQADTYKANNTAYTDKLKALDSSYSDTVKAARLDTLLFGDRFPFRYLVDDYGLNYYAAFVGCSAETEASFETVIFLAGKEDELNLPAVLVIDNSDQKIANAVISNTAGKNQKILIMDSMQSVTKADIEGGANYLDIMRANLDVLHDALN